MKCRKRLISIAGVLLSCSLVLSACQSAKQAGQQHHPKQQKESRKKILNQKKVSKKKEKPVAGIDKPTDDGFLLTDESQIENKTDSGLIVKHGDHKHFFFYSDLKGTKWEYLIPEGYKSVPNQTHSNANRGGTSLGQTSDGYVFNPKDIVAEDANGYTVRHGDHYHYILKASLGQQHRQQAQTFINQSPKLPEVVSTQPTIRGIAGLDYPTSDGFLFDGNNIQDVTSSSILVNHNGHLHPISFQELKASNRWAHLVDKYQKKEESPKPNDSVESSEKAGADLDKKQEEFNQKRLHVAKGLGISPELISREVTLTGRVALRYPHEDHTHIVYLDEIDVNKPFVNPDAPVGQIEGETLEERKERLIKEYMERFNVPRENITVDGNYMSVKHGDHAHVYKIDPNLPDDPERDVKTETTNLELEKQKVYGPFYTEGSTENLTRNGVYQKYHPAGVQNIKNFILLTFSTNSEYGDLLMDGKKTKRVYYLVRKDSNWEDVNGLRPETIKQEGRIFKGWSAEMPVSGKMEREHQSFYVDFDRVRKQPTKNVYGPDDDVTDLDVSQYVEVKYTTIANGRLRLGNKEQGGFTYLVHPNLTWKEAKEQGLLQPEPVANPNYEFIEYRNVVLGGEQDNDKVSITVKLAAFGSTAPYLGPYIAADANNPTDANDPSRHPNFYWHDPKNYVAVAFKAGEGGQVVTQAGKAKTAVYLVRKGYSLKQAGILPPAVQAEPEYRQNSSKPIVTEEEYNTPVTEDKVYHVSFEKKTARKDNSDNVTSDWLPGDLLPEADKPSSTTETTDSWIDDLLAPDPNLDEKTHEEPANGKPKPEHTDSEAMDDFIDPLEGLV
ncbi:pneumococcal-type histidine triad protein [Streptococcus dysgalactiae]|uniref:pneumococcal-type histidine triad protein n=1 Tax=Streptococcus dysgalactiae TaxID=1334 RepID=UPI001C9DE6CC|nr:pneumococcal-type histidine triad protein [Streptococcus dysgalactiae]QZT27090.1 pneumococcal-type histidine triad protein [Streptococcus dysgalactiae]